MKMPLEGFRKVSKDGNKTILRHPSGHEMTINHSILSPKMRGEIEALPQHEESEPEQKFDDGGEVEETPVKEVENGYNKFTNTIKPQPKPKTREEQYQDIRKRNSSNASGETSAMYADGGPATKEQLSKSVEQETKPAVFNDELEASLPEEESAAVQSADSVPEAQVEQVSNDVANEAPQQPEQYDHAKKMLDAHGHAMEANNIAMKLYAASQQPQQAQSVQPNQPAQQPVASQPADQAQASQPAQSQEPQGVTGLNNEAQQKINDLNSFVADAKAKNDVLLKSVMDNKIDPNRLYNSKSTGTKVVNAIGLILGGMGAGGTGGRNLAVDAMNHAIERDVDAQKADQSNQMNAYKLNLEATHNEAEARNLTINQLLSAAQGQLNKEGMKNQSASTKANVANVNQEIEAKKISNDQNRYLFKELSSGAGGDANSEAGFQKKMNTLRLLKPDFAKDLEAKYLPGVGVASVPIPETIRTEINDRKNLSQKLAALENFSNKYGGANIEGMAPSIKNQGLALAADAQNAYRSANKQGVFKESESKFVNKIIHDDPSTLLSDWKAVPGYRQTRHSNDATINTMNKSYGVKPFSSQQSIPEGSQAKTKEGVPVIRKNGQWVKQ